MALNGRQGRSVVGILGLLGVACSLVAQAQSVSGTVMVGDARRPGDDAPAVSAYAAYAPLPSIVKQAETVSLAAKKAESRNDADEDGAVGEEGDSQDKDKVDGKDASENKDKAEDDTDARIKAAVDAAAGMGTKIAEQDPFGGFFREVMVEPETDPLTGLPISEKGAYEKSVYEDDTVIDHDAFGDIGPGRRERLAELAGMSPEQAQSLWPWADPEPFQAGAFNRALRVMGKSVIKEQLAGTPEEAILDNLTPKDDRDAKAAMKRLILTKAEVSFTAYATLGLSLPIRVGRITEVPPDGIVVFNPEMLRADILRTDWHPRHVHYKWMNGKSEIYRGEFDVETYVTLPRPTAPTSHIWIVADDDVMAYCCIGIYPPANLSDAREQILGDVVSQGSYLRPSLKLYGLRWDRIPNVKDVGNHPQVRSTLFRIMQDLGMVDALDAKQASGNGPQAGAQIPDHMKPDTSYQWKADYMREMSGLDKAPDLSSN